MNLKQRLKDWADAQATDCSFDPETLEKIILTSDDTASAATGPILSDKAKEVLEEFDEAAQTWGWQCDQGTGRDVSVSEEAYIETKAILWRFVSELETELEKLKAK